MIQNEDTILKMKTALDKALDYEFSNTPEGLNRQARALDLAFRELLSQGLGFYGKISHYSTALRAQHQCLYTMGAAKALKRQETRDKNPPQT